MLPCIRVNKDLHSISVFFYLVNKAVCDTVNRSIALHY